LCLARALALGGQKVAVIDCDLRRSSLLKAVALKAETGLIEVLVDGLPWKDVMVSDPSTNVDILPCGKSLQASDDLFSSDAMERLVDELRGAYNLVILDCAPVLALAETRVIVAHADVTILVMRSQKTHVNVVRTALRVVRATGAETLGIVLNRVNPRLPGRSTDGDPLHYSSSKSYYLS
jgi:polysaccharide biosynthesis transport protein